MLSNKILFYRLNNNNIVLSLSKYGVKFKGASRNYSNASGIHSGNKELDKRIEQWLRWDQNIKTLETVKIMVESKKWGELSQIMLPRIEFGTAGLRGKMTAGFHSMNDLVITQTAQGILRYLEEYEKKKLKKNGVVIGFDGRYNSHLWAELTAAIFIHSGYIVKLFSEMIPTPLVPFSVTLYQSAIGIMITASHNPKDDNGYKVYQSNGFQIISPADERIQESIMDNLKPWKTSTDLSVLKMSKILHNPMNEVWEMYMKTLKNKLLPEHLKLNVDRKLLLTYTPLHGVAYKYIKQVFDVAGLKFKPVIEQKNPHPDFPTVKFPNPEEGRNSFNLAFRTAARFNSNIIIANDPDADRMCFAERNKKTEKWHIFNGNEIGAILGWWLLYCFKIKHSNVSMKNVYMISSTVSSKILQTMAEVEGFNYVETLTGFKWMGNAAHEIINKNKDAVVIFAFEEAIGYMCGSEILDKDGITAACQIATCASYLDSKNMTFMDQLNAIYRKYGIHMSSNSYFICNDKLLIEKIFNRIRTMKDGNYPTGILENKYKIKSVRDLTTGFDSSQEYNEAILPVSESNQMITFTFENGFVFTVRTSGTEPKIKYYSEFRAPPEIKSKKAVKMILDQMVYATINEFLQPKENKLIEKSG